MLANDHSMFNWIYPFLFLSDSVHMSINLLQVCICVVFFCRYSSETLVLRVASSQLKAPEQEEVEEEELC